LTVHYVGDVVQRSRP